MRSDVNDARHHLILTLDYELFGNGSGCLDHCLIQPTDQCLQVVLRYQGVMTLFVEALEFQRMRELSFSSIRGVEDQIRLAVDAGHELALHLHPQWHNASIENEIWKLDLRKWRIGNLSQDLISELVDRGLEYLRPLAANQPITTFRAGGWAIQPAVEVIEVLHERGFKIDSTVAPGTYMLAKGDWYDFRHAPNLPFWRVEDDVCRVSDEGSILEVPIASTKVDRTQFLKAVMKRRSRPVFPSGCSGSYEGPNDSFQDFLGKLSKLASSDRAMLDFCTMPAEMMIRIVKDVIDRAASSDGPIPIVAIGHNKNFTDYAANQLDKLLEWVSLQPDIDLSTYEGWLASLERSDV